MGRRDLGHAAIDDLEFQAVGSRQDGERQAVAQQLADLIGRGACAWRHEALCSKAMIGREYNQLWLDEARPQGALHHAQPQGHGLQFAHAAARLGPPAQPELQAQLQRRIGGGSDG